MARRRMVDPAIWDDEDVGTLSDGAFRLFVACISNSDDHGKLEGSARRLRGIAFAFRDDVSVSDVMLWLDEIAAALRSFYRYEVDGKQYIKLLKWHDWQKVDHPTDSKLPDPLDDQAESENGQVPDKYRISTGQVPRNIIEDKLIEDKRERDAPDDDLLGDTDRDPMSCYDYYIAKGVPVFASVKTAIMNTMEIEKDDELICKAIKRGSQRQRCTWDTIVRFIIPDLKKERDNGKKEAADDYSMYDNPI